MDPERDSLREAAEIIRTAKRAVAFTGAGASAESGIPTFRGDEGVWVRYPPERFGTFSGLLTQFVTRPKQLRSFLLEAIFGFLQAHPNRTHLALARLEAAGRLQAVITQNIDNLHREAGSRRVIELHGNLYRFRCIRCGETTDLERPFLEDLRGKLQAESSPRRAVLNLLRRDLPKCGKCDRALRPDIVFFGENLPRSAWEEAESLCRECDLMLVVGTSGTVWPAADLPVLARGAGAVLIEVNPEPTVFSDSTDFFLAGPAGELLHELVVRVFEPPGLPSPSRKRF